MFSDNDTSFFLNDTDDNLFNANSNLVQGYSCPDLSENDRELLEAVSYWVEGILQTGVAIVGILSNLASCYILTRKKMLNSFNLLLVTLAAYDTWYLFGAILESCRKFFVQLQTDVHVLLFPYFLYPLHQTSITGSIFMTVAIAFERYIAVHFPLDYNQAMNDGNAMRQRVAKYLIPVFVLSVLFNVPKFFEAEIEYLNYSDIYERESNATAATTFNQTEVIDSEVQLDFDYSDYRPTLKLTELRTHPIYSSYNSWSRFFVLGLIPFVLLVFFNVKIYGDIQERRQRRLLVTYVRSQRTLPGPTDAPMTILPTATTCLATAPMPAAPPEIAPAEDASKRSDVSQPNGFAAEGPNCMESLKSIETGQVDETSFMQNKKLKKTSDCHHKSLKKAACSVKKARQGRKRAKGPNDEGSNEDSEHSSRFSSLFKWSKLGSSVDEESSSNEKKSSSNPSGTPDSPTRPRIEITEHGSGGIGEAPFIRELDTVTIALSKSSNSFDQKETSPPLLNNSSNKTVEAPSPPSTLSNPLGDTFPIQRETLDQASPETPAEANNPRVFVTGDVTPPAPCILRPVNVSLGQPRPPLNHVSSPNGEVFVNPTVNNNNSNHVNGTRRRNEDSLAVIFMAIILIFLICHFPRILLDIHELATIRQSIACREANKNQFSLWSLIILNFSHFLLVLNSAGNLVVYCLLGSKFRAECINHARSIANKFTLKKRYM